VNSSAGAGLAAGAAALLATKVPLLLLPLLPAAAGLLSFSTVLLLPLLLPALAPAAGNFLGAPVSTGVVACALSSAVVLSAISKCRWWCPEHWVLPTANSNLVSCNAHTHKHTDTQVHTWT
jgi:hypothetical protein